MTKKRRILLVDDDREFVNATRELLEHSGYEVQAAHDGAAGLETALQGRPDLILLDVMMKSPSEGFEVSQKLHQHPELKGTPVILLTGVKRARNLPFSYQPDDDWLPVKAVLDKPVPPEHLLEEVRRHLVPEK